MSSSTIPSKLDLGILVDQGKELPILLREAKNRSAKTSSDILGKVQTIVTSVLNNIIYIKNGSGKSFIAKESLEKLLKKIQLTLEEFSSHDPLNKSGYEDLIKEVGILQNRNPNPVLAAASVLDISTADDSPDFNYANEPAIDYVTIESSLSANHKQLLYCFLLFPDEAVIKKREIIHCWIGMGLSNFLEGERLLAKFVAIGLIERIILNQKLFNKYRMPGNVYSYLLGHQENPISGSWSILRKQSIAGSLNGTDTKKKKILQRMATMIPSPALDDKDDPEALLNISQTTLDASRLKTMSGMSNLKVAHLGSWRQGSKKYIVVEDVEALKYLTNLRGVVFLSLEGVSGIVKLPESVYALDSLKVLDLRACNNLEQLHSGIKSLKNLTHLDLSGCYLLDHIPSGITSLTNLQVLKGFVINKVDQQPQKKLKGTAHHKSSSAQCSFVDLRQLDKLTKLSIITRRMDFPTPQDFQTICELVHLSCLRITWSGTQTEELSAGDNVHVTFPATLTKLELQAASDHTASLMLRLISEDTGNCSLEKLYITGGQLRELKHFYPQPTVVHLRYLPQLQIYWDDFIKLFPNLERLEVLGCPNLALFPIDDNGVWEDTSSFSKTSW